MNIMEVKDRPAPSFEARRHEARRHVALCREAVAKELRLGGLVDIEQLADLRRALVDAQAELSRVESGL